MQILVSGSDISTTKLCSMQILTMNPEFTYSCVKMWPAPPSPPSPEREKKKNAPLSPPLKARSKQVTGPHHSLVVRGSTAHTCWKYSQRQINDPQSDIYVKLVNLHISSLEMCRFHSEGPLRYETCSDICFFTWMFTFHFGWKLLCANLKSEFILAHLSPIREIIISYIH